MAAIPHPVTAPLSFKVGTLSAAVAGETDTDTLSLRSARFGSPRPRSPAAGPASAATSWPTRALPLGPSRWA